MQHRYADVCAPTNERSGDKVGVHARTYLSAYVHKPAGEFNADPFSHVITIGTTKCIGGSGDDPAIATSHHCALWEKHLACELHVTSPQQNAAAVAGSYAALLEPLSFEVGIMIPIVCIDELSLLLSPAGIHWSGDDLTGVLLQLVANARLGTRAMDWSGRRGSFLTL